MKWREMQWNEIKWDEMQGNKRTGKSWAPQFSIKWDAKESKLSIP